MLCVSCRGGVVGVKIVPRSEHVSSMGERDLKWLFFRVKQVNGINILPRSEHESTLNECCLPIFS